MVSTTDALFRRLPAAVALSASCYRPEQLAAAQKPEVIFSGKSNVGKSSMINRLCGRKGIARVSSAPGKTASVNFYDCGPFCLVDLPGYGYAKVSRQEKENWSELVDAFFGSERQVVLLVQLIDARHPPSEGDRQMLEYVSALSVPFVIALTKSDKLRPTEFAARKEAVKGEIGGYGAPYWFLSSQTGAGYEELRAAIAEKVTAALPDQREAAP